MKMNSRLLLVLSGISLASCARTYQVVPLAHKDSAKASILVYRKSLMDFNAGVKIYCNDTFIGRVGLYRYIKWSVSPGHYVIKAKSAKKATYALDVAASGDYRLVVRKTFGIPMGIKLELASETLTLQSVSTPPVKSKH